MRTRTATSTPSSPCLRNDMNEVKRERGLPLSCSYNNIRSVSEDDYSSFPKGHMQSMSNESNCSITSISSTATTGTSSSKRLKPSLSVSLMPQLSPLSLFSKFNGNGSPQSADPTDQPQDPFLSIGSIDHHQFQTIQSLGFGSGGSVVKVMHKPSGKLMAKKTITNETNTSAETRAAAKRELEILKSIIHPNIVSFFGSYLYDGELVIVMEYMDGGSLASMINQGGPVPEPVAQCIAASLISALEYLASKHVVHRDVKPANILLNTKGEVKLTDFGVSKNIELSAPKTFTGTHGYLPPEKLGIPVSNEIPKSARTIDLSFDWFPKDEPSSVPSNAPSSLGKHFTPLTPPTRRTKMMKNIPLSNINSESPSPTSPFPDSKSHSPIDQDSSPTYENPVSRDFILNNNILLNVNNKPISLNNKVSDKDNENSKADIWSFGITLYEILFAFPYSRYPTIMDIIKAVQDEPEPSLPDTFSSTCRELISLCLSKDVKQRYGVNECIKHPWIKEVLDRGTTALPPSPSRKAFISKLGNTLGNSKQNSPSSSKETSPINNSDFKGFKLQLNNINLSKASTNDNEPENDSSLNIAETIKFVNSPEDVSLVPAPIVDRNNSKVCLDKNSYFNKINNNNKKANGISSRSNLALYASTFDDEHSHSRDSSSETYLHHEEEQLTLEQELALMDVIQQPLKENEDEIDGAQRMDIIDENNHDYQGSSDTDITLNSNTNNAINGLSLKELNTKLEKEELAGLEESKNCQIVSEWLKKVLSGEIRKAPVSPGITSKSTMQDVRNALNATAIRNFSPPLSLEDELIRYANSSGSNKSSPTSPKSLANFANVPTNNSDGNKRKDNIVIVA